MQAVHAFKQGNMCQACMLPGLLLLLLLLLLHLLVWTL
jgi:hypothetical protein